MPPAGRPRDCGEGRARHLVQGERMTRMSAGAAGALAVLVLAGGAIAQTGQLDQSSPATNAGFNLSDPSQVWQQQVRSGTTGRLTAIRLTFFGNSGAQAVIRVRKGDAWATRQ